MTFKEIIDKYSKLLKTSSPLLDVELLLSKVLNKPKEYLFEYPEKKVSGLQLNVFKKLFSRRLKGEPVAYILGHKEFYGLDFKVNKNVLIPRPETELLVEESLQFASGHKPLAFIDLGVGSGAIIIALAKNLKKGNFYSTEISLPAIKIAQKNAKFHKVKIDFLKGNLLEPIIKKNNSNFILQTSIIVANLPYLDKNEIKNLTLKFEPRLALYGGPDGLKYFREFFHQIQKYRIKPLAIFLEIGHNQAAKIKKLAHLALPKYKCKIKKDLCGFDRLIIITN